MNRLMSEPPRAPPGRMRGRRVGAAAGDGGPAVGVRRATRTGWVPAPVALRRWTTVALGARARGCELVLLVVGPRRIRALNRRYRGQDRPTNVLSFPAATAWHAAPRSAHGRRHLGDIVICPQVLRREAQQQGKAARAHWMHLYIHGVLHLLGHDHARPAQAQRMERREVRALRILGVANPYLSPRHRGRSH